MTRCLLLGGTGFLGRHIEARLRQSPEVQVITASRSPADHGRPHLRLDLSRATASHVAELVAEHGPAVVVNAAGLTGGEPDELAATNVGGTATLVEALLRGSRGTRLVHLGSAAEYGRVEVGTPVAETTDPHPTSVYGVTKLAATRLVLLGRTMGLDAAVLRVFNPIGPGAPGTTLPGRLARELLRAQKQGNGIHLGPLGGHRDFIDARDVAEAVFNAATASALKRPLLNVGSGRATMVRTLVDELIRIADFTGPVDEGTETRERSGQVSWQQADLSSIRDELQWEPTTDLTASLVDLWHETVARGLS